VIPWKTLTVATVAAWLGVMVFFSFFVAPIAFSIDRAVAGQVVTAVLPRYLLFGLVLTALGLVGVLSRAAADGAARQLPALVLGVLMLAILVYTLLSMLPAASSALAARDDAAFAGAHRAAVRLNLAAMVAAALILVVEALGLEPPPET
jgi:hypothetical protein